MGRRAVVSPSLGRRFRRIRSAPNCHSPCRFSPYAAIARSLSGGRGRRRTGAGRSRASPRGPGHAAPASGCRRAAGGRDRLQPCPGKLPGRRARSGRTAACRPHPPARLHPCRGGKRQRAGRDCLGRNQRARLVLDGAIERQLRQRRRRRQTHRRRQQGGGDDRRPSGSERPERAALQRRHPP